MAYSVNWITKIITIPTSDLTLVSGTRYKLLMSDFLAECRRLEWSFSEGLWAPPILDHSNTRVDFAGVDYAPFDEVVNGYTAQITGVATRVDLLGSNNNIIDVLIATGVSVVPSNSAGLQIVSVGSGLSTEQATELNTCYNNLNQVEGMASHAMMMRNLFAVLCGTAQKADTNQVEFMSADGTKVRVTYETDEHGNRINPVWNMSP